MLLLEGFDGGADIVAVFFKRQAHGIIVAGFAGAASLLKLRVAKFPEQFRLMNTTRFAVEARLQIGQGVRSAHRQAAQKKNYAAHRSQGRPAGPHALTFSVPACVEAPCSAVELARLDRDFYPDRVREISGKPLKQAGAGSAYRSKSRG